MFFRDFPYHGRKKSQYREGHTINWRIFLYCVYKRGHGRKREGTLIEKLSKEVFSRPRLNFLPIAAKFSARACIIKLITAVIYSFCNKLECLLKKAFLSVLYRFLYLACQGQTLQLITKICKIQTKKVIILCARSGRKIFSCGSPVVRKIAGKHSVFLPPPFLNLIKF